MAKTLSVIVPTHNEEASIDYFYERAQPVLEKTGLDWNILFVNDASRDSSLDKILALRKKDPRVRVVTLSRNSGYHSALVAGLTTADSDLYSIVDTDCEDPPELLGSFYEEIRKGAHTVYGIRSQRDEPGWVIFCRWLFYHINRMIADGPIRVWMAEFVMITRPVRDAILKNRTTFPFLRAEMCLVGLRMQGLPYKREKRKFGQSHYNFLTMAKFAVGGFLASSTFPLRAVLYMALLEGLAFLVMLGAKQPTFAEVAQAASILTFLYLIFSLPMIALYIARTYKNGSGRPVFYVDPDATFLS